MTPVPRGRRTAKASGERSMILPGGERSSVIDDHGNGATRLDVGYRHHRAERQAGWAAVSPDHGGSYQDEPGLGRPVGAGDLGGPAVHRLGRRQPLFGDRVALDPAADQRPLDLLAVDHRDR